MGEPGDTCGPYCGRLAAREPASVPVLDPRHLYWGLLERLYNPAGNTQIVNVYFRGGELDARTCVSAAHIFLSAADRHRDTGARGLPPPDASEGHRALHEDILSGPTPAFRAGTGLVFSDTTPEAAIRAAESAWTGGHYLERPIAVDIDHT